MWASRPSTRRGEGTTTDATPTARSVAHWGWRHCHPIIVRYPESTLGVTPPHPNCAHARLPPQQLFYP
eukprot:2624541-Pleurochrysis_carterae.AAC.2